MVWNRIVKLWQVGVLFLFLAASLFSCGKTAEYTEQQNQSEIDSLMDVARDSLSSNIPFVRSVVDSAMTLVKDSLQYHEVLLSKASCCQLAGSFDSAYTINQQIVKFCKKKEASPRIVFLLASAYNIFGIYHQQVGSLDSSIFYLKKAYDLKPSGKLKEIEPNILINLADTYLMKGDLTNSAFNYRKALFVSDSLGITGAMGFPIYFGLGQVYLGLRDFDLSDSYFRMAEKTLDKRTLGEKFTFCNNRGTYYYYKEEYSRALPWFKKARALVLPRHVDFSIYLCELNMSDIFLKLNQLDSAQYYADRSYRYFSAIKQPTPLFYLTTIKAGIALKQNRKDFARRLLDGNNDTTGIQPNIVSIRNKFLQDYYEQIGDYKLAYQFLRRNVEIDGKVQSERVRSRVVELDMRYKQDTSLLRRDLVIQNQKSTVKNLQLTQFLWIFACCIILATAAFFYFYMKKQRDLQRVRHFDQVTKLRMQSIRNRISPHFIFNVLNRQIVSAESEKEQLELRGLVKLLRKSLEISEQLSVSLAQELEFVQTYINLEKKSLGEDFSLDWDVDGQIDSDSFRVPAMIVQIPVENAIKHALRGKEGAKILKVSVKKQADGVGIQIQDNGAGYYPGVQSSKGTGTGLKVIYQTIQLLNAKNDQPIAFTISNLSKDGVNGTRVEIYIPGRYLYEV
jgi:tetratricopeptide (TPR) repeat protein